MKKKIFRRAGLALASVVAAVMVITVSCDTGTTTVTTPPPPIIGQFDGYWYVANYWSGCVDIICGQTLQVVRNINFAQELGEPNRTIRLSHLIVVCPDERFLWAGEIGNRADIWVFDLWENEIVAEFTRYSVGTVSGVASGAAMADIGMVISRDGRWVFSGAGRMIHIFCVETITYLGSIDHLNLVIPGSTAVDSNDPHILEVTHDHTTLWVSDHNGGHVVAYDITMLPAALPTAPLHVISVIDQINHDARPGYFVGIGPAFPPSGGNPIAQLVGHAIAIHRNDRFLFLGSFQGNALRGVGTYVIDIDESSLTFGEVLHRVPGRPHNFAMSPDGNTLVVCDNNLALHETDRGTTLFTEFGEYLAARGFTGLWNTFLTYTIDISTLATPNPDFSTITITGLYGVEGVGRTNHVVFSECKTEIHVTYDGIPAAGPGTFRSFRVNTEFSNTVTRPFNTTVTGSQPHAIAIPGYVR
ncbi:MAG: hypothetical protein FWC64_11570 [Treponema sp.]|nr:hypothetical protein [Treponema sp.]